MKYLTAMLMLLLLLTSCQDSRKKEAESMLQKADQLFKEQKYDRALIVIDSLRKVYPEAIEARKQALTLQQNIELKRSQEELVVLDSLLQAVKLDYENQKQKVEKDKEQLKATPEELTRLTKTRVKRDSLQTRFDVLLAKVRYIHQKQK